MQNLLLLFARVGNTILFVFLQIICIYLIVNYNQTQRSIFINSSNIFASSFSSRVNSIREYMSLGDKNERLAEENSKLLESLVNLRSQKELPPEVEDTVQRYTLMSAEVINNSIRQKNNKITINKGIKDGIEKGQGVINGDGLIGIINDISNNNATALSLLNMQISIAVKIKRTNEIGELKWDGKLPDIMNMSSVPPHSDVKEGDQIITSGFSTIFPPDLLVGIVKDVNQDKRNGFLILDVELNNDLSSLDFVYIIKNHSAEEQIELEVSE